MADRTSISWTDATWNPLSGCSRVSEGCRNCYAEAMAARFNRPGQWGEGLATMVRTPDGKAAPRWTGEVRFNEAALDQPLRWRKPRRIFVNSTSDLFHESVPDEWIDKVFAAMAPPPRWGCFFCWPRAPRGVFGGTRDTSETVTGSTALPSRVANGSSCAGCPMKRLGNRND